MESGELNDIEKDLLEGFSGFVADLKGDSPLPEKYTVRRLVLDLEPQAYGPDKVRETRKILRVSQAIFAKFLGVSVKTVRAWELGKTPNDMACRFMDEIQKNPEHWRKRLADSAKQKQ